MEQDEAMAQVNEALAALSPRDREVLLLWDAGISYQEIAEQTGLAVGAVGDDARPRPPPPGGGPRPE